MTQAAAIIEALRALDPTNDNHWTADGQPRLDTVKMLASDPSITREAVTLALPGFNRTKSTNGDGAAPLPPPPPKAAQQAAQPVEKASPGKANGAVEPAPQPIEKLESKDVVLSALQEELVEAEKETQEARTAKEQTNRWFEEARAREDVIRLKLEELTAKDNTPNAIQSYLESQKQLLSDRADRKRMIAEAGISLRDLSKSISAAPIDQSMARRTGRGGSRPQFPRT